ncbi:MAG: hypothetical protein ACRYHQ_04975 [Janthinobacterium lividum]
MPDPAAFDLPPRRALAAISPEARTAWRLRYCVQEGTELHAQARLEKVERELRATGAETTIHTLWMALASRAAAEDHVDVRAAAGLAAMAMGLVGVG